MSGRRRRGGLRASMVLGGAAFLVSCGGGAEAPDVEAVEDRTRAGAIERVIEADAALSGIRNHASETAPVAEAVEAYVAGLDAMDFAGTPEAFREAFRRHRDAWAGSVPFLRRFDDLRGEMHDVFDRIRERGGAFRDELERHEAAIWSTWDGIEAAAGLDGTS